MLLVWAMATGQVPLKSNSAPNAAVNRPEIRVVAKRHCKSLACTAHGTCARQPSLSSRRSGYALPPT
eukprot:2147232-Prymnesium_polylepis.1